MKLAKVNVVGADTGRSTKAHRGKPIDKDKNQIQTTSTKCEYQPQPQAKVISRTSKWPFDGAAEHGAEH